MADRPIIFSAPMVRALLDGRKTQTRRVVKNVPPQPAPNCHPSHTARHPAPYLDAYCGGKPTPANPRGMGRNWHWWQVDDRPGVEAFRLPYAPGDRLWVREAWAPNEVAPGEPIFRADYGQANGVQSYNLRDGSCEAAVSNWRPSIHMPRWVSRLTLTVTDVRVQRLNDISEEDAIAEGIDMDQAPGTAAWGWHDYGRGDSLAKRYFADPRNSYRTLWNSIHGPDAWAANPWVCALTFTVARGNIDGVGK
jgi:hypothetical protein